MAGLGALGRSLKSTGLDKVLGVGIIGVGGIEAAKYALINPALERVGIKPPSYVPPPAMSQYEEVMLGRQQQPGFLGYGAQQRTQGLIEKRALFDMDQQRQRQVMSDRIAQMQLANNSPLALTRTLADRDRYTSSQNALASVSASMANSMVGAPSVASQIGYSQTNYAQPTPMNYDAGMQAVGRMRRGGKYNNLPPGMPMTQELREQMQYSPKQMGQFSGRGGAIARGYDSAKYGYVDNMVPLGAEQFATGTGRRRRGRS